jgi:hypothetical protein
MSNKSEIQLIDNIRVKIKHACPVKEGSEAWRVIVSLISDYPDKDRIIKDYSVWVTGEYLEDKAELSADINSAEKFALDLAKKRFEESGKKVPVENGVSCSNREGVVFVSPKEFVHPRENE